MDPIHCGGIFFLLFISHQIKKSYPRIHFPKVYTFELGGGGRGGPVNLLIERKLYYTEVGPNFITWIPVCFRI